MRDFRVGAAHHAADRLGAFGVGDHQHVGGERARLAVERLDRFAGLRAPHDDRRPPRSCAQIERVHRLAELEQHVVGDVDDVADRPHAAHRQPVLHPLRGGADGDVGNRADVAAAQIGRFDGDRDEHGRLTRPCCRDR